MKPWEWDIVYNLAQKADNEQTAYITTTSVVGAERIWANVSDRDGVTEYTPAVEISSKKLRRQTTNYFDHTPGRAGATYRLLGGDAQGEITTSTFTASGRWTP